MVRLRPVLLADLEPLARLHARCFPEESWNAAALAGLLAMPGASARLAEATNAKEGAPLGLLFALVVAEEAEILTLGVDPDRRRQGVARALLADLFARARSEGARRLVLEVAADNAAALSLYESQGFRPIGERRNYYRRIGGATVDAWLLQRPLIG
jgi:ribosomal-protein-alanine N-acetyltransferase